MPSTPSYPAQTDEAVSNGYGSVRQRNVQVQRQLARYPAPTESPSTARLTHWANFQTFVCSVWDNLIQMGRPKGSKNKGSTQPSTEDKKRKAETTQQKTPITKCKFINPLWNVSLPASIVHLSTRSLSNDLNLPWNSLQCLPALQSAISILHWYNEFRFYPQGSVQRRQHALTSILHRHQTLMVHHLQTLQVGIYSCICCTWRTMDALKGMYPISFSFADV